MASLLNPDRPPAFCPGCSHSRSLQGLDLAFQKMGLTEDEVIIVSDIGCAGLFDTFFRTHAFHGLHGRALTYGAGIKLAQPHAKVVVAMGDGGLGIGGTHLLAACRRNLDLTLLVLNNFNFGMTGGQFSCTTPETASSASGFLNLLEKPMDVCTIAAAAGAPFVTRTSAYKKDLSESLVEALSFDGFSVVDIWGICTGRYAKKNPLSPKGIDLVLEALPPFRGLVPANERPEYGSHYRERSQRKSGEHDWMEMEKSVEPSIDKRREVLFLGDAGARVITAGTLLAHSAILAGMHVTQKNDYNITVMRGPSVTEVIISPKAVAYTGVEHPDVVFALSQEGVDRGWNLLKEIKPQGRIILNSGVSIPKTSSHVLEVDFKRWGIKKEERALGALSLLARTKDPITPDALDQAIRQGILGKKLDQTLSVLEKTRKIPGFGIIP